MARKNTILSIQTIDEILITNLNFPFADNLKEFLKREKERRLKCAFSVQKYYGTETERRAQQKKHAYELKKNDLKVN